MIIRTRKAPIQSSIRRRRRRRQGAWLAGGRLCLGHLKEPPLPFIGKAEHGAHTGLLRRVRRRRNEIKQLSILREQVQHVVIDGVHPELLHEPLPAAAHELGLLRVRVAPLHGVPDRLAHADIGTHGPVVHLGLQPPAEEVLVPRVDHQRHGAARQDVLEADRPREPFRVDLVPVRALRRQRRVPVPGLGLLLPILHP